jgi:alkanesulfonate monooxygenase SsuD/methylene tetrahydromethanopterin reductase-like flavin-dependent oxidoreductase (luciferase family)
MLPIVVTDDVDGTHSRLAARLEPMTAAPSYAAAVAREGGIPMVAGSEDHVTEELEALAAAGVTDFVATRVARRGSDDEARTRALITLLSHS